MAETQNSSVSNQLLKRFPRTTNASERHAARKARTSTTHIRRTVDSNQVIVQMRPNRTSSVREAHAIPIWDRRHPRKHATHPSQLKPTQVQRPRAKLEHATLATNLIGHIAPNCPDKAANKQKAQSKLLKNKNFMVLWQESWDDQDEQACATRVVEAWGDDNLCPICHKDFTFNHRCDPEDKCINKHFDTVKSKLRQSPLLKLIREAHEGTDQESFSTDNVLPFSMNHSYFVGEDEGQQEDTLDHNQDHSDDEEDYPHSQSDSHSNAEGAHESRDDTGNDNDSDVSSNHSDSSAPY
jgi:hypothetical protein